MHILDEDKVNNIIKLKGNEERMGQPGKRLFTVTGEVWRAEKRHNF